MNKMKLGSSDLEVPKIAVGCMRLNSLSIKEANIFLNTAIDKGVNFFDHADIYGRGKCEEIFSQALELKEDSREKIIIQSKCGIVPGVMYDFSKEHIINSVDGILKRLKTDYLDVLALHRPDALVEPEEVAEAFDILETSGKVRNFGVSNHNPMQIELLRKFVEQPILVNQLQFSIPNSNMVSNGINVNMNNDSAINRDGNVLDYSRLNDMTIQAWSPFQYGMFEGVFLNNSKFPKFNEVIERIAKKYEVSNTTIALSWILRHPAKIMPVTGTMNIERLSECIKAMDVKIDRQEWYEIYMAAGNKLP